MQCVSHVLLLFFFFFTLLFICFFLFLFICSFLVNPLIYLFICQRLSGASLLIFANKQDIKGALTPEEIAKVRFLTDHISLFMSQHCFLFIYKAFGVLFPRVFLLFSVLKEVKCHPCRVFHTEQLKWTLFFQSWFNFSTQLADDINMVVEVTVKSPMCGCAFLPGLVSWWLNAGHLAGVPHNMFSMLFETQLLSGQLCLQKCPSIVFFC